jgi:hypothetical protein
MLKILNDFMATLFKVLHCLICGSHQEQKNEIWRCWMWHGIKMRNLICSSTAASIMTCLLVYARFQVNAQSLETVRIQVEPQSVVSRISPDFVGLGYESSAVAQSNYFSAENATLIQLYRNLNPHGLIRIGGCASDNTQYVPDGTPVARDFRQVSIINHKDLVNLGEFARATGWKVMWGLNLGHGTKVEAVKEAAAVDAALGSQLQSFQVGNEVEGLPNVKHDYAAYHTLYLDYKDGIRAVLPNAPFSGPDSVGHWDFITNFVSNEADDMKLLTQHYYCSDAHDPKASIEKMLTHDNRFETRLKALEQLCRVNGIGGYRINEVNSFSSGGKPGVSDTFASALWVLDYMFMLASCGCDGVNMETDINHLAFVSHYSPIVHDTAMNCSARPEYYGMLAFAMAGKGDLLKLNLEKGDINLSAYATKDDRGFLWFTVVNKDFSRDAAVEVVLPETYKAAASFRLKAPSMESKNQVTFAGTEVSANGKWKPKSPDKVTVDGGAARLIVPHASAVVLRLSQ